MYTYRKMTNEQRFHFKNEEKASAGKPFPMKRRNRNGACPAEAAEAIPLASSLVLLMKRNA